MARGNGEGSIYDTIQKIKKDFDNTNMCKICSECEDRSFCNNRQGWIKCDKCKKIAKEIKLAIASIFIKKTFAQISTKKW